MDLNASRSLGWTLYRYIGLEVAFPFLFTLGGLTLAVATQDLLRLTDLLLNRGIGASKVAGLMFFRTLPIAAEMIPLSLMVGALVALGRLVSDREIIALEACGISARRLHAPVVAIAAVVTLVAATMATTVSPWSRRSQDAVLDEIFQEHPGSTVTAGRPHSFGSWRLQAREVSARGDRMRGVVLWTPGLGDTLFAESGALDPDPEGSTRITLTKAALVLASEQQLSEFRFDSVTTLLPGTENDPGRFVSRGLEASTLRELRAQAVDPAVDPSTTRKAQAELQRRFARPTATLFFALLVISLFLARGAASRASGGILGLVAAVLYYGLMQLANGLVNSGSPVALAVWMPTIVLALAGGGLFLWAGRSSVFAWRMERSVRDVRAKAPAVTAPAVTAPAETESRFRRWPSSNRIRTHRWALQRYVAGRFLVMLGFSFGVLLVGYLLIDILERLQWFARFNATASEAMRFYSFRIPVLISRLVPMALLVATALTVSLVAVQGELTGMRACGVPAPRGMLAVLLICALIAPLSFVLNNEVVPRVNTLIEYLQAREIKAEELWEQSSTDGTPRPPVVWIRDGSRQLEAARLDPQLGIARGLTIYELGPDGLPTSRTDARGGRYIGGGVWRLSQATRVNVTGNGLESVDAARFSHLWETVPIQVNTRNMSVAVLREEIQNLQDEGHDPTVFRVDLFRKYAAPIGCIVLPAVAFFFAVSGPPYPSTAASLVVSVFVAVGSVLLTGLSTSMGYRKVLPPMVAGMAPTVLLASVALYLGLRLRGMFVRA